jgi:hypothetical protein
VTVVEQHVRDVVIAGINDEPLNATDGAVCCLDAITAAHLDFAEGHAVEGGRLHAHTHPDAHFYAHAAHVTHDKLVADRRRCVVLSVARLFARPCHKLRQISLIECRELSPSATKSDLIVL